MSLTKLLTFLFYLLFSSKTVKSIDLITQLIKMRKNVDFLNSKFIKPKKKNQQKIQSKFEQNLYCFVFCYIFPKMQALKMLLYQHHHHHRLHRRHHNFECRHQPVAESMNHKNVHIVVAHFHATTR